MFIRINPDEENFNTFEAINEIHRHIKKSTKKSLIDQVSKRLLELEFNNNKGLKKSFEKSIAIIIKLGLKRKKGKTCCFSCRNFTYNTEKDKKVMRVKVIREKSRCFNCNHKRSTFLKQRKKS